MCNGAQATMACILIKHFCSEVQTAIKAYNPPGHGHWVSILALSAEFVVMARLDKFNQIQTRAYKLGQRQNVFSSMATGYKQT